MLSSGEVGGCVSLDGSTVGGLLSPEGGEEEEEDTGAADGGLEVEVEVAGVDFV